MNRYMFYFVLLLPLIVCSQIISFEPDIDTLKIGGGCTPPQIIANLHSNNPNEDSISVTAGWNTSIWSDKNGEYITYPSVFFSVQKSGSDIGYQLYICSFEQITFGDTLVRLPRTPAN